MELSVADALKRVGESFPFQVEETILPIPYGGRMVTFAAPLSVIGSYVFDGKAFLLSAKANTVLNAQCARCAVAFAAPYGFAVEERFVKASELEPDEESYPYLGTKLDIAKAVMDNLLLHLPLTSVCKPDCKGLCPVCGGDRNVTYCNCESIPAEGPFGILRGQEDKE